MLMEVVKMEIIGKEYKKLKIGDLLFNPFANDLWVVSKRFNEEKNKDEKFIVLIHDDYCEDIDTAYSFTKIGNVYDYANEVLGGKDE